MGDADRLDPCRDILRYDIERRHYKTDCRLPTWISRPCLTIEGSGRGHIQWVGKIVSSPLAHRGMSFGNARTSSQQMVKRAQHLNASHNSISRPRRNIAQSFGTSGPYARCPLTFADDWTFHLAT